MQKTNTKTTTAMTTERNKENHKRFIKHLDESKP